MDDYCREEERESQDFWDGRDGFLTVEQAAVPDSRHTVEWVRYVRDSGVREIYSCWFDDEGKPTARERTVTPEALASPDFVFGEQELLRIDHDA